MTDILRIDDLHKRFGSNEVLRGLTMHVTEHSIYGFVGQNGAGKTTTMRLALGLLRKDGGEITVGGRTVAYGNTPTNRFIGYLPDVPEFYGYLNAREYLRLCGGVSRLDAAETKSRSEHLLALVGLDAVKTRIRGYSHGMKQRLGIAQALLGNPRLLICDEPTSALDPVGRKEILDILLSLRGQTTVLFSTHILSDVERICDTIGILHHGVLALQGNLSELKASYATHNTAIEFKTAEDLRHFRAYLRQTIGVNGADAQAVHQEGSDVKAGRHEDADAKVGSREGADTKVGNHEDADAKSDREIAAAIHYDEAALTLQVRDRLLNDQALFTYLTRAGLVPRRFEALEPSLENLYMETLENGRAEQPVKKQTDNKA